MSKSDSIKKDNKKKKKKVKNLAGKIAVYSMLLLMIASTIAGLFVF